MKKSFFSIGIVLLLLVGATPGIGQTIATEQVLQTVPTVAIVTGYHTTTNLLFPYAVRSVDRGSDQLLVQKAKKVESILQIKAASPSFTSTNLSVVTADAKFYSLLVTYADSPTVLNYRFGDPQPVRLDSLTRNEERLGREAYAVRVQPAYLHRQTRKGGLRLRVEGIYYTDKLLWCRLALKNESPVDFQPESIRFFEKDKRRVKRSAVQETSFQPMYAETPAVINHDSAATLVFALTPYLVPPHKRMIIEIGQPGSGRMITTVLKNRHFLKGRRLPD